MGYCRVQRADLVIHIIAIRLNDALKMFEVFVQVVRFAGGE